MKKNLFVLLLITSLKVFSTPASHTITFNVTTSVTCEAGDTLKFYGTYSGDYIASSYSGTVTVANIFPTIVSIAPFYIGYFIITGNETSFIFSEISHGSQTGTIHILSTAGILNFYPSTLSKIYPNPFKNEITLSATSVTLVDVFSFDGSLILSLSIQKGETVIDFVKYQHGIYFIRNEGKIYKVIKE